MNSCFKFRFIIVYLIFFCDLFLHCVTEIFYNNILPNYYLKFEDLKLILDLECLPIFFAIDQENLNFHLL